MNSRIRVAMFSVSIAATVFVACATTTTDSSDAITERLITATTARDAEPLVKIVLSDVIARSYRFDDLARKAAFAAVTRLRITNVSRDLIRIASMQITDEPTKRLLDVMAVAGALSALTESRRPGAIEANVGVLQQPELRGFAILNLRTMQAWDATPAVEQTLENMPLEISNGHQVANFVAFLDEAPNASQHVCAIASRIEAAYPQCETAQRPSFCDELLMDTADLRRRLCTQ